MSSLSNRRKSLARRAAHLCEICGDDLVAESAEIHHRKFKSWGGRERLSNLMIVHPVCHDDLHAQWENRPGAYGEHPALRQGWIVPPGLSPGLVPLVLTDGRTVFLGDQYYADAARH